MHLMALAFVLTTVIPLKGLCDNNGLEQQEDTARKIRLQQADEESQRIRRARELVLETKRKYKKLNEEDRKFYKEVCGISDIQFSRARCKQLKKEFKEKEAQRSRDLQVLRQNVTNVH
jgi:hypothetical protein